MPFEPGHKKLGGKEKGTPNKTCRSLIASLNEMGMGDSLDHPVVWMFKVAHGLINFDFAVEGEVIGSLPADSNQRITCMKEVAKYVSPQLKAVEHSVDPETKVQQFTMIQLVPMNDSKD